MTRAIPDLLLERYRLNELPQAATAAIEREIADDPAAAERLAALARSDEEIRAAYAPARFAPPAGPRPASPRAWVLAGTLATIVMALLAITPRLPMDTGGEAGEVRIKGAVGGRPSLSVYR